MRSALLGSKYCKERGVYFDQKIPVQLFTDDQPPKLIENYLDYGVPFKFGFVNENNKFFFNVPNLRTRGSTFLIHSFRKLPFKAGDRIRFNNKFYDVEDVSMSFLNTTNYKTVKQYFISLK